MHPALSTFISSCVASLVAVLALYFASNHGNMPSNHAGGHGYASLTEEGAFLFRSLDVDGDGVLTPHEVAPVIEKLVGKRSPIPERAVNVSAEQITVRAHFQPLVLETLRSGKDYNMPTFLTDDKTSFGLRNWTTVVTAEKSFNTLDFSAFLPPLLQPELGRAWRLYEPADNDYKNSRYFPPMPHERVALLSDLLRMFHPRPFMETRFSPRGAVALVRAQNEQFLDVAFRFHAEFQLNEPPAWPFWFTPAQFTGNVVISRDGGHVEYFHLYVPAKRSLNVDMEWLTRDSEIDMEVEIGYMPRMELESTSPSVVPGNGNHDNAASNHDNLAEITWREEITWENAEVELERAMYPFKQVVYHPFETVFDRATAEKKLVHNIVLWGALDDQSC